MQVLDNALAISAAICTTRYIIHVGVVPVRPISIVRNNTDVTKFRISIVCVTLFAVAIVVVFGGLAAPMLRRLQHVVGSTALRSSDAHVPPRQGMRFVTWMLRGVPLSGTSHESDEASKAES